MKLGVALVMFAVGCGSSSTDPGSGSAAKPAPSAPVAPGGDTAGDLSKIDGCALLKPKEIDAALPNIGAPMKEGNGRRESRHVACVWSTDQNRAEVELTIDPYNEKLSDFSQQPGFEPVPGVGEAAYHGQLGGQVLAIKHKGMGITLVIRSTRPPEEVVAAEKPLATALLGRL